ncbi:MAG TPA: SDR family NAD(P)-dependent oxidoreductase [Anditalea sp.]|nr:SDR family NAD(P)-dependent oxidoreductase [Anditalea sp.]
MDIAGKIAVVTGVSKGIGYEIVAQLLEKGVIVAGWGRSHPDLYHDNFQFFPCDVSDELSVEQAYQQTVAKFGKDIRIVINNAGYGVSAPIEDMTSEEWRSMFDTNVHGIFYVSKRMIKNMKKQDEGHIVNISSIAGLNGVKNFAGYSGTKHAVRGISHSMYMELREWGIKVTTIYPGSVNTNFFDTIEETQANENMIRAEDVAQTVIHTLETHPNYFVADVECRPLRPKGKN